MRAHPFREFQHFTRERHFQIQKSTHIPDEQVYIFILNVAPILSKVGGDSIRAAAFTENSCGNRIGFLSAAGLPQCRDVIHVYV